MPPTLHQALIYIATRAVLAILIISTALGAVLLYEQPYKDNGLPFSDPKCNVAVIPINGMITTLEEDLDEYYTVDADSVVYQLRSADSQEHIKAVLLEIDSSGGRPVASEMVANELLRTSKPTVALIREGGMSGAYMLATGADTIIASSMSDVGSIGVTASYVETAGMLELDGGRYIELSAGKYKDAGDPDRILTDEEKDLILRDINAKHEKFIEIVATNRNMPIEKIRELADGSSMTGEMALEKGLIDAIGDEFTAENWITERIDENVVFCDLW